MARAPEDDQLSLFPALTSTPAAPRARPPGGDEDLPPGILGMADVESLTRYSMAAWKQEQDRRPLPRQLRLRTLLRGIPAVWLNPMCGALGLDPGRHKLRKDRERAVAEILRDADRLRAVVREKLAPRERELVAYLLEKGGQAASGPVTRRFGRDLEDGWFWNEEPPTSVLGRVRLHGLAFVGRLPVKNSSRAGARTRRQVRTVAIPRELREVLGAVFEDLPPASPGEAAVPVADPDVRGDVVEAIDRAFPDGVVDMTVDGDLSYFADVYPRLAASLSRVQKASVAYERDPDGEEDSGDLSYSYHLLFVTVSGLEFETEDEVADEDDVLHLVQGTGTVGCSIAVSLVAPFAKVVLQTMEVYQDGRHTIPDIKVGDVSGGAAEELCHDRCGEAGLKKLLGLREELVSILGALEVEVLPAGELAKVLPWLEAGEDAFVGVGPPGEERLTVEDAFFFRGP